MGYKIGFYENENLESQQFSDESPPASTYIVYSSTEGFHDSWQIIIQRGRVILTLPTRSALAWSDSDCNVVKYHLWSSKL